MDQGAWPKSVRWSSSWCAVNASSTRKLTWRSEGWNAWKKEQDEQDDHDREASMTEALTDKTKVVKLVVDKWFVDRGFGFGKVPTGEIVFIHANAVVGVEVLTIGTDAWVQVVNDDASSPGEVSSQTSLGTRRVASREGQRESEQGGPAGETSSGTDC